jgi:hypothetical protein
MAQRQELALRQLDIALGYQQDFPMADLRDAMRPLQQVLESLLAQLQAYNRSITGPTLRSTIDPGASIEPVVPQPKSAPAVEAANTMKRWLDEIQKDDFSVRLVVRNAR